MFIKIWQLIILHIDRMDWRAGHLTTTEGTEGGAFANKNCPQGRAFEQFFQMPGGMLAARIDSHVILNIGENVGMKPCFSSIPRRAIQCLCHMFLIFAGTRSNFEIE